MIAVLNYVIAARPSLRNFMIADNCDGDAAASNLVRTAEEPASNAALTGHRLSHV